jgi:hypothetical protein
VSAKLQFLFTNNHPSLNEYILNNKSSLPVYGLSKLISLIGNKISQSIFILLFLISHSPVRVTSLNISFHFSASFLKITVTVVPSLAFFE